MSEQDEQPRRPLLRVVRGTPDDLELAALTGVVAALASRTHAGDDTPRRSAWGSRAALLRQPRIPGPGAWQAAVR